MDAGAAVSGPPPADRDGEGVLAHTVPTESRRQFLLQRLLDPETKRILTGLRIRPNWRCLELGAGFGSIARWLGEQCPEGRVVATDVDVAPLKDTVGAQVEVLRHDVTTEGFPTGSFDLIHARMLLFNLPARDAVLTRAADWLAPGGWLVVEEPDAFPIDSSPYPAFRRAVQAGEQLVARSHGAATRWARGLPEYLRAAGLVDLGLSVNIQHAGNGAGGNEFWRVLLTQLRPGLLGTGLLTETELAAALALFDDPGFVDAAQATVSAWGRRPTFADGTRHRTRPGARAAGIRSAGTQPAGTQPAGR
ncbi:MAG TPA: class I SAM-dependent methyltransferase [Pseudonocardia sp.]|nr:class I SAM-dependent methyltransferase [Pseudonocardia sp.]